MEILDINYYFLNEIATRSSFSRILSFLYELSLRCVQIFGRSNTRHELKFRFTMVLELTGRVELTGSKHKEENSNIRKPIVDILRCGRLVKLPIISNQRVGKTRKCQNHRCQIKTFTLSSNGTKDSNGAIDNSVITLSGSQGTGHSDHIASFLLFSGSNVHTNARRRLTITRSSYNLTTNQNDDFTNQKIISNLRVVRKGEKIRNRYILPPPLDPK